MAAEPTHQTDSAPCAKRLRSFALQGDSRHADWVAHGEAFATSVDYLKILYPHDRDSHCTMVEKTHTYYVLGEKYDCSVSSVWKVLFS